MIVDSEPIHYEAERLVLASFGIDFTPDDKTKFIGNTVGCTAEELSRRYGVCEGPIFLELREQHFYRLVEERLELAIGASVWLDRLVNRQVPMTLVTSGTRRYVDTALAKCELEDVFDFVVTADDVTRHKPLPDPYLRASDHLGISSHHCLAVEDSHNGLASAKLAGMYCVAVKGPAIESADLSAADEVFDSLTCMDDLVLDRLFGARST